MNNYKVYFDCGTIIKCKDFELKNWKGGIDHDEKPIAQRNG